MGFYDGLGGVSERSSAWEVADLTDTPVILLVDMKGRSPFGFGIDKWIS